VAPESQTLLLRAAERGDNLGTITAALLRLPGRCGTAELRGVKPRSSRCAFQNATDQI
jgi:hypothetical protein